jgi:hypothetical protein
MSACGFAGERAVAPFLGGDQLDRQRDFGQHLQFGHHAVKLTGAASF